jgi:hypothetical protein
MKQDTKNLAYLLLTMAVISILSCVVILLLVDSARADTVIVIPSNGNTQIQLQPQDPAAQMAESWNWNIRRNAAIGDAIRLQQLLPAQKIEIDIEKREFLDNELPGILEDILKERGVK